jgi:hypothetical protein
MSSRCCIDRDSESPSDLQMLGKAWPDCDRVQEKKKDEKMENKDNFDMNDQILCD